MVDGSCRVVFRCPIGYWQCRCALEPGVHSCLHSMEMIMVESVDGGNKISPVENAD